MTQEELELLKELQPVIRKNMGCAEIGDNITYISSNGPDVHGTIFLDREILIPDAISRDPERPQRGLWGMIDWSQVYASIDRDGDLDTGTGHDSPYLVLLNTLKWQTELEQK